MSRLRVNITIKEFIMKKSRGASRAEASAKMLVVFECWLTCFIEVAEATKQKRRSNVK